MSTLVLISEMDKHDHLKITHKITIMNPNCVQLKWILFSLAMMINLILVILYQNVFMHAIASVFSFLFASLHFYQWYAHAEILDYAIEINSFEIATEVLSVTANSSA